MINYADRFREFLGQLLGVESLDDPAVLAPRVDIQRADYLLFQRSIIVEIKQLETDPEFKVEAIIDRYKSHPSYPLSFGERTLQSVLEHMPAETQEEIRQGVYDSITRAVRDGFEKANRQIRETRAHFELTQASGVVFFLNDRIPILSPNVLGQRIHQQMMKRRPSGADRFPEIAYACAITWAHFVRGTDGTPAHPIITMEGPAANSHPAASSQLDYIFHAWSHYHGSRLIDDGRGSKDRLEDYQSALPDEPPTHVTRQEAWRQLYRQQRYLAALVVDELMEHGRTVFAELNPHFLIGGERKGDIRQLMQRWADFLEECEIRNLDMKLFKPKPTN